jgi:hypothetical protein
MPTPGPLSDDAVIWPLVDASAAHLSAADRGALFADIAAGDYLPAVERLLQATLATAQELPSRVMTVLDAWLDRYEGAAEQPAIRRLLRQALQDATNPPHGPH